MKWERNDSRPQHPLSPPHTNPPILLARRMVRGTEGGRRGDEPNPNSRSDESPLGAWRTRGFPTVSILLHPSPAPRTHPPSLSRPPRDRNPSSLLFKSLSSSVSPFPVIVISLYPIPLSLGKSPPRHIPSPPLPPPQHHQHYPTVFSLYPDGTSNQHTSGLRRRPVDCWAFPSHPRSLSRGFSISLSLSFSL